MYTTLVFAKLFLGHGRMHLEGSPASVAKTLGAQNAVFEGSKDGSKTLVFKAFGHQGCLLSSPLGGP